MVFMKIYLLAKVGKRRVLRDFPLLSVMLLALFLPLCSGRAGLAAESSYSDQQLIRMSEILHNKEKALQEKESVLREKEKRLLVLQQELQEKEKNIENLRKKAETVLTELQALKDEDLSRLVEVFTAMKPAAAAPLMEKLDLPYAVEVILRMKPRKAAKLLSAIEPARAAAISRSITTATVEETK